MQIVKADKDQLIIAVEAAISRLCAVLSSVSNPDALAVGTWSVRDVAAHLANGVPLYTRIVRGERITQQGDRAGSPFPCLRGRV